MFLLAMLFLLNSAMAQVRSHKHPSLLVKYTEPNLEELSGMVIWNNTFWCINDSGHDAILNVMNLSTGAPERTILVENAENNDWEAIAQDSLYFYIGDFGNNSGRRTDLAIYRIEKRDLLTHNTTVVPAKVMQINYPVSLDFPEKANHTDYDAEAMVVIDGIVYLFTKRWVSGGTEIYRTPFLEGQVTLEHSGFLPVNVLVTDAHYDLQKRILYLLAYHKPLTGTNVILYALPGEPETWNLSSGERMNLGLTLKQAEALAGHHGNMIFIGCEGYKRIIRSRPAIYILER